MLAALGLCFIIDCFYIVLFSVLPYNSTFFSIYRSGVLTALFGCYILSLISKPPM